MIKIFLCVYSAADTSAQVAADALSLSPRTWQEEISDTAGEEVHPGVPGRQEQTFPAANLIATTPNAKVMQQLASTPLKRKRSSSSSALDEIIEMHLAVLRKESLKLDMEMENLLLKKKKLNLQIQELEARSTILYLDQ